MKPPLQILLKMIVFGVIFLVSPFTILAQTWKQVIKVTALNNSGDSSARSANDFYGRSVAISGNYAIVSAYFEDEDGDGVNTVGNTGAAYILYNNAGTWMQIRKITAPVREANDLFGHSVSISGDYAIVGALSEDEDASEANTVSNAGSAYIFKKDQGGPDNWGLVRKVVAPVREVDDKFGYAVSISGDYAIVGAYEDDEDVNETNTLAGSGSAYIFKMDQGGADNWGLLKKITATIRGTQDWFGFAVDIKGDYIIVGAHLEKEDALEANTLNFPGSAYIFKKDYGGVDHWGQVKKIVASDRGNNDLYGWSVAISGEYAIVSAYVEDEDELGVNTVSSAGSAYIYKRDQGGADNWGQVRKIVEPVRAEQDNFGVWVDVEGDYAVVGAFMEDEDASEANTMGNSGSVYIFKKDQGGADNWGLMQKITTEDRSGGDNFGVSLGIDGEHIIVGAYGEDDDAAGANAIANAGSAYFFALGPPLPVTLISFEAIKSENQALLDWTTTMESNSAYFDIQKSGDAHAWQTIGRVLASVNSEQLRSYTFNDNHALDEDSPGAVNLYRLKMVDSDGSFAYSRIVSLSLGNARRSVLYPNPVFYKLFCNPADVPKIESVTIINSVGQVMLRSFGNFKEGISVDHLNPGAYIGQIRNKAGSVQYQKIIVTR
ncbi:T9SS type A sorting domain-containing protein [Dyadobacter jiangsuensis]|uniref:T9SS type A sorting domain-containing protein n=1 Tax=Dyadobacter jiangsuensis TaxID=1591085 RepID=UPI0014754189|nr:T9SS type A sorting domain-containing protein [Dyadobacter jiangsuensis]